MNVGRLKKEIDMLARDPGPGISAWPESEGCLHQLTGQIVGPDESPYEGGMFYVSIDVPQRYPFEPPSVRFTTPIFHPNIDSEGRVCLDTLKMQPQGSWSPSVNINTLLLSIRILLRHPNADDGLVPSITELYRRNIDEFNRVASEHTLKHAKHAVAAANPATTAESRQTSGPICSKISYQNISDGESVSESEGSYESDSIAEFEADVGSKRPPSMGGLSSSKRFKK